MLLDKAKLIWDSLSNAQVAYYRVDENITVDTPINPQLRPDCSSTDIGEIEHYWDTKARELLLDPQSHEDTPRVQVLNLASGWFDTDIIGSNHLLVRPCYPRLFDVVKDTFSRRRVTGVRTVFVGGTPGIGM